MPYPKCRRSYSVKFYWMCVRIETGLNNLICSNGGTAITRIKMGKELKIKE
jgi:hypothetical protein